MVVAAGYPTPPRTHGIGLEISYNLMTGLIRAPFVVGRKDGLFTLEGPRFTCLPTKLLEHGDDDHDGVQAVQWHVLPASDALDIGSVAGGLGERAVVPAYLKCTNIQEFEKIASGRVFLGSWGEM